MKRITKYLLLIVLLFSYQSGFGQTSTLYTHNPFTDFNSSPNPGTSTDLWLNIHTNLSGELAKNGDYIIFAGGTLTLTGITSTPQITNCQIPNGEIIADNTITTPITSYDTTINTWITKVPVGYSSSDIFICGAIVNSSTGFLVGSGKNSEVAGCFYSNLSSFSKQWMYGLACYQSTFTYSTVCSPGKVTSIGGGTPAGTPTTQTNHCVAGGSGGGGSNYCGSYSSSDKYTTCGNYYGSIGDFVWDDVNHNGIQNTGEAGISNVTVKLYTSAGVLVSSTTTNSSGKYLFSNLKAGSYYVQFVVPSGYTVSPALQGKDTTIDSNPNSSGKTGTIYLTAGQNNLTIDCGMYPTPPALGSIGDFVWNDANHNGIQDAGETGISNITVNLYTSAGVLVSSTTTNSSGKYLFSNLSAGSYYVQFVVPSGYTVSSALQGSDTTIDSNPNSTGKTGTIYLTAGQNNLTIDAGMYTTPPALGSIGDFVWNDANHNGIQDAGEAGISNVTVNLYTSAGVLVSTTTTNSSGKYLFSNLSAGSYYIQFVIPSGYTVSPALQGTDTTIDSNPNSSGKTGTIYLTAGQNNLTIDAGMYTTPPALGSIGDFVWNDANHNGIQDAGEAGISNVTVNLYTSAGVLVSSTTTNSSGKYLFSNLAAGSYYIQFVVPSGYTVSPALQGSDTTIDSNPNSSGKTGTIYLTAGQNNLTIDAGMYTTPPALGSIGDFVWNDANHNGIQDAGEAGISNVTVNLYTSAGVLVSTTTTDANGKYLFSNLAAGSYYIQFIVLSGYTVSPALQGADTTIDSNPNAAGKTGTIYLTAGQNNSTIDAGMYLLPVNVTADLKIEKSASKVNPICGDNFSYTIIVTNLGPNSASNVVANDVLPAGIVYQSSSATVGSFNNSTGVWTVGTLTNGATATLILNVSVDCTKMDSTSFDLGTAKGFNLFVIEDLNQPSCDTQGKVAVGHNATLSNYSIGDQLPSNSGDVLVVGNNLSFTSGAVLNGNVVYGNATNLPQSSVSIAGSLTQATPIDFTAAQAYLQGLSVSLGNYTVNGTTTLQWGGLKLTGSDPFLNVFKVNGSDLSSANDFQIDVPNGSVVVVNINGTNVSWEGGLVVTGTAINNVLYNFYQATNLSITGINVRGSILAPNAALTYPSGLITGQVFVHSMTGSGQFNLSPFQGNITVDTVITNTASVTSTTADTVTSNNTSSATITVGGTTNNSGGTGTSGTGTGNSGVSVSTGGSWANVCSFSQGQIVYALLYDESSIYAGITGGKIYKSTDNGTTWTLINSGMNVSFIWSLLKSSSSILAATENGVYIYNGTTWTLTSLNGKDVHALTVNGNSIYAGTWGFGIFKSNDSGATWDTCNSGLDSALMVQSLTVYNGSIFAGTVGGGLFKSTNGSSWTKAVCGYQSIWSLGSTSSAIFAGTYGDGLYKSVDGGSNFVKLTSLPVSYIYNIMTDTSGKIYVSSLTNGVFVSADNGVIWNALGMGGYNVSALMVNPTTSDVYAGTKAGTVYKMSGIQTTTGTTGVAGVPKEFILSQNYPNPFNPSTMINFSVAKAGLVTIKVYNILGKEIVTLVNEQKSAGDYSVQFSANRGYASGVYFYRMQAGSFVQTKKLLLLK